MSKLLQAISLWRQRRAFKRLSPAWQRIICVLGEAPATKKGARK